MTINEATTQEKPRAIGVQVEPIVINRFVYHYSSHYQTTPQCTTHIDGIAQITDRIFDMEGYHNLKKKIDPVKHEILVIDSLSFLGMEKDL